MEEILGTEINIIFVHKTIANLFRIVGAVVATVNQKRQLLVPVILNIRNKFFTVFKKCLLTSCIHLTIKFICDFISILVLNCVI